jgi:hypothetical protein
MENSMKIRLIMATVATILGTLSAQAAPLAEDALESQARYIHLPSSNDTKLEASGCESCPTQRFEVTPASTYVVNGQAIDREKLRLLLASQPALPVVVAYFPASLQLSRIIVTAKVRQ